MARTKRCSADLSDTEWALLGPLLIPSWAGRGWPPGISRRELADVIFYVLRTGCQWRDLPKRFPHWNTVDGNFAQWRDDETWERANDALRYRVRVSRGHGPEPSAAIAATMPASR